ncbi:hypothetical protein ACWCQL_09620 [Streptomyces sp. NPDC002073]|uniref:hypothetical protein n=1 Tax=Streptomyces sp. NBC_00239 TaxID=2903640 RepID=UPI002E28AAC9|nr:hypothetical protein [Streptomyces sp. NBC_00239]
MISDYQQRLREQFLSVPVVAPPVPWYPIPNGLIPIGGLLGIGFALAPDDGRDLVMVVSVDGHGLFDTATGEKIARDRDPDPDDSTPEGVESGLTMGEGPAPHTAEPGPPCGRRRAAARPAGPVSRTTPHEGRRKPGRPGVGGRAGSPVRLGAGGQLTWIETSSRTNEVCRDWSSTDAKSRVTVCPAKDERS